MVSTISAHGARVSVDNTSVVARPTPLFAALSGSAQDRIIPIASITAVSAHEGDEWDSSAVEITADGSTCTIDFSPGDTAGPAELVALLESARRGEDLGDQSEGALDPGAEAGIAGLNFVGFDVETANQNWGSICQIGLVKMIDGKEVERASWLCTPPPGLDDFDPFNVSIHSITADAVKDQPTLAERVDELVDFVGDLPLVAHNAQFDATALHNACAASGREIPQLMFACTLAQSRAMKLDVHNHKLPVLAEYFRVNLDNHHDACEDAAACAGIMVGLARRAHHQGSLLSFIHGSGFSMGVIDSARVTPVLRDRSGATRALQAQWVEDAADGSKTSPTEYSAALTPQGSNQHEPTTTQESERGSAPWQSVATPETVPEPNPEADPEAPLHGHYVTLTGEFEPFSKGDLWAGIADQGAQVGKNVTKKTTILVTGEWASVTSKEKRARELQDQGQALEIWTADKLIAALGLDEQPPF